MRKLADLTVCAGPGVSYKRVRCLLRDETTTIPVSYTHLLEPVPRGKMATLPARLWPLAG